MPRKSPVLSVCVTFYLPLDKYIFKQSGIKTTFSAFKTFCHHCPFVAL